MNTFEPWIRYPQLTKDRLSTIAKLLRDVRQETVKLHDPDAGDTEWSLGCRIYSRSCFAITEASAKHDWLDVLAEQEPLRFSFAIGRIPFRFYRGNADDPPGRYIETTFAELNQRQYVLEIEGLRLPDHVLRLAIETDASRLVSSVILVELDEAGNVINTYAVPFDAESNVTPLKSPPIVLPPVELPAAAETMEGINKREPVDKNASS
jgi:hypothetical protein